MKRKILALLVLVVSIPALAMAQVNPTEAGLTVSGQAQQLGAPANYGSASITVAVPADNAAQEGINPITGEAYSGSYQPVLVNIDSHPRALPHWGVASADLIYELPIQKDGSTRQLALFMSEYPEMAGPVRSARIPMCSLREMWGGPYYFFGYQSGTTSVKEWVQKNSATGKFSYPYVELMNKRMGEWYNRTNDGNHVAPYNVTLVMSKVREEYAVTPSPQPFLFSETGLTRGEDAPGIIISYKATNPAYLTAYQYNEATGLYDRYRNGAPYTDALTGEQCAYANVIVVRTDVSFMNNNSSRPVIRLNGQGVCEIFQNGKYIRGTWVRDCTETSGLDNRMIFLDENGQELPMKVGKTFIQIVDNEQPVIVVSESAIAGSVEPQEQRLIIGDGKTTTSSQKKIPKATATPTVTPTATPTATPEATPEATPDGTEQGGETTDPAPGGDTGQGGETTDPAPGGDTEQGGETTDPAPGGDTEQGGETTDPAPGGDTEQGGETTDPAPEGGSTEQGGETTDPALGGDTEQGGETTDPAPGGDTEQGGETTDPAPGGDTEQGGETTDPAPEGGSTEQGGETTDPVPGGETEQGSQTTDPVPGGETEQGSQTTEPAPEGGSEQTDTGSQTTEPAPDSGTTQTDAGSEPAAESSGEAQSAPASDAPVTGENGQA